MTAPYEEAAHALKRADCAIAVTGAGVSVESGIPDFRGAHGIWARYPPEEYASVGGFLRNPAKVWNLWYDLGEELKGCRPNPAHYALAELEQMGRLHAVITQNVDNMHQEAGSRNVLEYHGNARQMTCLDCGKKEPVDLSMRTEQAPRCACGGLLKPDVVMFGDLIPREVLAEAEGLAERSDVVLVVGTSAQVFPAAQLPMTAKGRGAFIIEANTEATDFTTGGVTDAFLEGRAGETLPNLVRRLKA